MTLKLYAYLAGTLAIVGAIATFWYTVHVKPLNVCNHTVVERDAQLIEVTALMTEAYGKLYTLESNNSAVYIKGVIKGVEGHEENITIDFDNFHY